MFQIGFFFSRCGLFEKIGKSPLGIVVGHEFRIKFRLLHSGQGRKGKVAVGEQFETPRQGLRIYHVFGLVSKHSWQWANIHMILGLSSIILASFVISSLTLIDLAILMMCVYLVL
ncbi:hypothetical protein LZ32DRAFT_281869 [Colletotrichum eremochloae]|nr:hypothetical protein LZ32DRAFT_281869 [Colletotrichum eremochloae]